MDKFGVGVSEEVRFKSGGVDLWGRFNRADSAADGPQPLVVMATGDGLSGSKSSTWTDLSRALEEAGISSFIFDFQGLGNSDGKTAKLTLSIGLANLTDAMRFVNSAEWVDAGRVAILASSFGGNLAILYAATHGGVSCLGLKSPVSFYPETLELMFGDDGMTEWKRTGFNAEYGFNYSMYLDSFNHNTYAAAANVTAPALITHGDSDHIVPIRQSMRLLECNSQFEISRLPGVDHDYAQGNAKEVMVTKLTTWLGEKLS
jgi:uncharacterized protein